MLDIALQAVEGELVGKKNDLGDAVNANDHKLGRAFPYLALPNSGSDATATEKSAPGSSLLRGGSGIDSSTDDTMTLAGSAAAGGAAVLLMGVGLVLWRMRRRPPRRVRRH